MLVVFEYSVCYGKGDYSENCIQAEITEEEYARIEEAKDTGEEFVDCKSVSDIYNRIYDLADEEVTADLIAEEILDKKHTKASEVYPIEVYFP